MSCCLYQKNIKFKTEKPFKFENLFSPVIRFTEASGTNSSKNDVSNAVNSNNSQQSSNTTSNNKSETNNILSAKPPIILATPQQLSKQAQLMEQTPSTIVSKPNNNNAITNNQNNNTNSSNINVHKQLKYEDSPSSLMINQSCDLASLKSSKYQHSLEKNLSLAVPSSSSGCCKHSKSSSCSSSSSSSKHHHHHHSGHHHHHHHYSSSSGHHHHHHHHHSSSKHHHHHHHHQSPSSSISSSSSSKHSSKHHQYVNAIPSILTSFSSSKSSSSNRYINQSDLCTQIITGNLDSLIHKSSSKNSHQIKTTANDNGRLSYSSSSSSSSSSSCNNNNNETANNNEAHHRSLLLTSCSAADNSMRCTLRRGRPNTPKTGLSVDYRIRKSSVPNTPESKHSRDNLRINYTISNDDIKIKSDNNNSFESTSPSTKKNSKNTKKSKSKTSIATTISTASLNTAMVLDDLMDEEGGGGKSSSKKEDLDVAFNGDEDIEYEEELDTSARSGISLSPRSRSANNIVSPTSTTSTSKLGNNINGRQISLSLNNLPNNNNKLTPCDSNNDQIIMDEDSNDVTKSLIDINQMTKSLIDIAKSQSNQSSNLLVKKSFSDFDMVKLNHELELANSCVTNISSSNQDLDEDTSRLPKIVLDQNKLNEDEIECDEEEKKTNNQNVSDHVKEQQKLVQFEPFKLPTKNIFTNFDINDSSHDDLLQNVLRRQSLFKLKEKINGKVSKQINEIEKRKLSPYRFCNSPLKNKKAKESLSSLTGGSSGISSSGHISKNKHSNASPLRVPSIFCKKILGDKPEENYIVKMDKRDHTHKLSRTIATSSIKAALEASSPSKQKIEPKIPVSESPLIVRAANQFYKKLNRNRSVKRLNATISNYQLSTSSNNISQVVSNLSSIPENVSGSLQGTPTINKTSTNHNGASNDYDMEEATNMSQINTTNNSPTSKQLINSSDWQCSESIDL